MIKNVSGWYEAKCDRVNGNTHAKGFGNCSDSANGNVDGNAQDNDNSNGNDNSEW